MRRPAPALLAFVRAELVRRAGVSATGAELLRAARATGLEVDCVRRVQEALKHLLEVERYPVAASCSRPMGYRLGTVAALRRNIRELDNRTLGNWARRKVLREIADELEGRSSPQLRLLLGGAA